jgi:hypothetical protein
MKLIFASLAFALAALGIAQLTPLQSTQSSTSLVIVRAKFSGNAKSKTDAKFQIGPEDMAGFLAPKQLNTGTRYRFRAKGGAEDPNRISAVREGQSGPRTIAFNRLTFPAGKPMDQAQCISNMKQLMAGVKMVEVLLVRKSGDKMEAFRKLTLGDVKLLSLKPDAGGKGADMALSFGKVSAEAVTYYVGSANGGIWKTTNGG